MPCCDEKNPICCEVCNCLTLASSDNTLSIAKTGCAWDFKFLPNNLGSLLNIENSGCITVVKEYIGGKLVFTPTINPSCLEVPVSMVDARNGINYDNNPFIELGGALTKNTEVIGAGFDLILSNDNTSLDLKSTSIVLKAWDTNIAALISDADKLRLEYSLKTDYDTGTTYYTKGDLLIEANGATLGYAAPAGSAAPAIDPLTSSYIRTYDKNIDASANKIFIHSPDNIMTSGTPVSGRRYQILDSSGSADFTASQTTVVGNGVGKIFVANGVVPIWGTGSLKLIGEIITRTQSHNNDTTVIVTQDDHTYSITSNDVTNDIINVLYTRPDLFVNIIAPAAAKLTGTYYAIGEIAINNNTGLGDPYTRIGHHIPASDTGLPPAVAPTITSKTTYTDGKIENYAAVLDMQTGCLLVEGQGGAGTPSSAFALIEGQSTTKGFLFPRMNTTQKSAITVEGMVVYDLQLHALCFYNGSVWKTITST